MSWSCTSDEGSRGRTQKGNIRLHVGYWRRKELRFGCIGPVEDEDGMALALGPDRPSVPWLGIWTLLVDNGQSLKAFK